MSRRKAFTLVELLVVVAIIALLVAILLPSLKRAKEITRTAMCMVRMRDFRTWIEMFRQDNSEWWPVNVTWAGPYDGPGGNGMFVDQLTPYMGSYGSTRATDAGNDYNKNYFQCPANGYTPLSPYPYDAGYIWQYCYISWGWRVDNYMVTSYWGLGNLPNQVKLWWPKRGNYFGVSPGDLCLMGEIWSSGSYFCYYNWGPPAIYGHLGKTNMLMVDGHVESLPPEIMNNQGMDASGKVIVRFTGNPSP